MAVRATLKLSLTLLAVLPLAASCSGSSSTAAAPSTSVPPATMAPTTVSRAGGAAADGCRQPHAAGQSAQAFDFQGQSRTYQLYVPRRYDGAQPVPVVFEFHGYGSNAVQQVFYGDFRPLAERDGFLIVAPDGQGKDQHFNLTGEAGLQDDVAMVGALLDHIEATFCVDARRVYATGMSDGGAMTSVLACRTANRFAAFAAVAVVVYDPTCTTAHPVAIAAFSGTADPIVPFNGGPVQCCGGTVIGAAPDAMARWAQHDGCSATFTEDRLASEVRRRSWSGCQAKAAVVFYIIDGGGHTWPGAVPFTPLGLTTQQIKASETIWDFFTDHPLAG
jgi:polyhydroxybutyrate depolymerase